MTTSKATTRVRAEAKITVQKSEAKPYDQSASPELIEVQLRETFTGDGYRLDGLADSVVAHVRVLQRK